MSFKCDKKMADICVDGLIFNPCSKTKYVTLPELLDGLNQDNSLELIAKGMFEHTIKNSADLLKERNLHKKYDKYYVPGELGNHELWHKHWGTNLDREKVATRLISYAKDYKLKNVTGMATDYYPELMNYMLNNREKVEGSPGIKLEMDAYKLAAEKVKEKGQVNYATYLGFDWREEFRIVIYEGQLCRLHANGDNTISVYNISGNGDFVFTDRGVIYGEEGQEGEIHHTTFGMGLPVKTAGWIRLSEGNVVIMNNESGHYRCDYDSMLRFIAYLECRHCDLSKTDIWNIKAIGEEANTPYTKIKNTIEYQKLVHEMQKAINAERFFI